MKINEKSKAIGYFVKLRDLVLELEELDYTAWYDENILGGKLQKKLMGILEQQDKGTIGRLDAVHSFFKNNPDIEAEEAMSLLNQCKDQIFDAKKVLDIPEISDLFREHRYMITKAKEYTKEIGVLIGPVVDYCIDMNDIELCSKIKRLLSNSTLFALYMNEDDNLISDAYEKLNEFMEGVAGKDTPNGNDNDCTTEPADVEDGTQNQDDTANQPKASGQGQTVWELVAEMYKPYQEKAEEFFRFAMVKGLIRVSGDNRHFEWARTKYYNKRLVSSIYIAYFAVKVSELLDVKVPDRPRRAAWSKVQRLFNRKSLQSSDNPREDEITREIDRCFTAFTTLQK
jgi:hypothetical protein